MGGGEAKEVSLMYQYARVVVDYVGSSSAQDNCTAIQIRTGVSSLYHVRSVAIVDAKKDACRITSRFGGF